MIPDPIQLQERLAALLDAAHRDDSLRGEMARARREFFGSDLPGYVDPGDERGLDAAAQRFAEWFLLERPSEVLGTVPIEVLGDPRGADRPLVEGRTGLFLVEAADGETLLRDLDGGEKLQLDGLPIAVQPGDVLVGRLFRRDDERHLPSAVLTVLSGSPQVAVAFQRDVRRLALGRRLLQIELEHLVFRRLAAGEAGQPAGAVEPLPAVERVEAELQALLDAAGVGEQFPVTAIAAALRGAADQPGSVMGPLLDQLAFETGVDLDRTRELLLELYNAQQRLLLEPRPAPPEPRPPTAADRGPGTRRTAVRPPAGPAAPGRAGETLGERLARRLEEGLAAAEDVDALFADVERIFGESIDDEDGDEDADLDGLEVGDLEPLVREFVWEHPPGPADEARLQALVALQQAAPVPRTSVEYLEPDDYLRYLLEAWLGTGPEARVAEVQARLAVLERFHAWLLETQDLDFGERLGFARRILVDRAAALEAAARSLGGPAAGRPSAVGLTRVIGRREGGVEIEVEADGSTAWVEAGPAAVAGLCEGDLLLGPLGAADGGPRRFVGPVVAVPAAAEHLLG
jgi:hypothetical protein